ncbi:unnamed protein product [marine sediment metagenome]|uniref:Uncharacterized protein n=1 Tax=marine sediment metagenome TaxID=412755 RepID=X1DY99_9ZZZZ
MEEEEATQGIGMEYDYVAIAAQAVVDRERYIQRFLKNIRDENQ